MFNNKIRIDWIAVCSSCLAFIIYSNSFKAGFVYDDNRAILSNQDVLPGTSWTGLWTNDFWGTPLSHSGSHKSFRPLATLSFRLNYYFSGFNPASYHVTNVLLHTLTTWLFVRVARIIFRSSSSVNSASRSCSSISSSRNRQLAVIVSSLLFACHPIHCEAVSGVVGRTDVGATGFALSAFLLYVRHVKHRDRHKQKHVRNFNRDLAEKCGCLTCLTHRKLNSENERQNAAQKSQLLAQSPHRHHCWRSITYLAISILLAAAAMFTKEQGITILLVCATYDLVRSIIRARQFQSESKPRMRKLECCGSVMILGICFLALFHLRLSLMGGFEPPKFSKADNPTAHHPNVCTRFATFLFLPVLNVFLLVYPYRLSYDWSMESIPRVEHVSDPRNIITVLFYFFLIRQTISSFRRLSKSLESGSGRSQVGINHSPRKKSVLCSVCWLSSIHPKCSSSSDNNNSITCPTQPPTPRGIHHQSQIRSQKQSQGGGAPAPAPAPAPGGYCKLCSASSNKLPRSLGTGTGKTLRWRQVQSVSGRGQPPISTSTTSFSDSSLAIEHGALLLELAFLIFPFLPATNLFFYVGFVIAERVLYMPSVGFSLLVGHGFLQLWTRFEGQSRSRVPRHFLVTGLCVTVLLLCGRSVRRNEDWEDEEKLYSSGIRINPPKSWGNLGNVLSRQGRTSEAEGAYRQALRFRLNMADVHYNLGLVLERQGRLDEALTSYRSAIHFRPLLALAYLNAAQVLTRQRKTREAMELYKRCFELSEEGVKDLRIHIEAKVAAQLRYGKLLVEEYDDPKRAIGIYRQAVTLMPPNFSQAQSVYSAMGEALSRVGQASEAEEWFKEALNTKPDHIPAYLTYGKMLARNITRLHEAESWFRRAKRIAPADAAVYQHYGQFLASQGRHAEAAESYVTADALTPNDYEIVVGAANGWRQAGDHRMAEIYYEKAVALRPQEARAHMNLGAILHLNRKYAEAHRSYLTALHFKPDDSMTLENLKKLCQLRLRGPKYLSILSCV